MAKQNSFTDKLEGRARRAIFWHALWRWESAVILALTLVISSFLAMSALAGLFPWLWTYIALGIGFLAEALIFVSSLTDEEDNARVVAAMLRDEYNPKRLRSMKLQAQLDKALEYRGLIANTARRTREGVLRDRLARATEPVDDWIEAIYRLATRLDAYERNQVLKQDVRSVPLAIENFKQRLAQESDPTVQQTLRNTIADKERQWEYLSKLQNTMENAEYQLESTLAALGTVYAQLQTIDVRGAEKGHADRLRQEIDEQVAQLQDLSEAMDEVYQAGS
jgi:biopolymer transport protein ExbB/TolQ